MASIGELTATVRADISGYVGPMRQVAQTNQQVATSVGEVGKGAEVFKKVQHVAVLLSAETAGLGSHIGQLVNKFGMLAGGGGIMLVVAGAIAALGVAFRKLTEDTQKHNEAIDGLVDSYKEATGAVVRLRLEEARTEMERTDRGRLRVTGTTFLPGTGIPLPTFGRVSTADEQTRAITALQQAQREYDTWLRDRHEPAEKAAAKAEKERLDALRAMGREISGNLDLFGGGFLLSSIERTQKQLQLQRNLKAEIEATAQAQRETLRAGLDKVGVGDTKGAARDRLENAMQGARDTANGIARAFMSAFSDNEGTIMDRIGSVLKAALLGALEKLIAQEIFSSLLSSLFGGVNAKSSNPLADLPVVGGLFGAPSAAGAVSGSGAIIVPLQNLPAPRSPVEMARDQLHQAVWVETARVALQNGVNLQPRFR